jgi:hypothetical protein
MKNELLYSELATVLFANRSTITTAAQSRDGNPPKLDHIVRNGNKYIDVTTEKNRSWIENYASKKDIKVDYSILFSPLRKNKEQLKVDEIIDSSFNNSTGNTEESEPGESKINYVERKRKLECKKLEGVIKKDNIQLEKITGNLIPVNETGFVLNYAVSNYTSSASSFFINTLGVMIKELGGSDEDYKRYVEMLRSGLIEFAKDAVLELENGIEGVVNEYKEVLSRGERK